MTVHESFPLEPIDYLRDELNKRQARRPDYSLRAFARDLNLSPSTVSELLSGKVGLSINKAEQLAQRLKLETPHSEHFCDLITAKHARSEKDRQEALARANARARSEKIRISLDRYSLISEWQHFAILELVDLNKKYHSVASLAKALRLEREVIEASVERLVRLGELSTAGDVWKTESAISVAGDDTPSTAIRSHHEQVLRLAIDALHDQPVTERDYQSAFFCIDNADIPKLKQELDKFRRDILKRFGYKATRNQVYMLSTQLFAISKKGNP